mgnify:CR=1 FL=1
MGWQELKSVVYFNDDKERSDEYDLIVRCGEPKISAYLSGKSVLAETTKDEVSQLLKER